jgi:hypothetical protein
LFIPAGLIIIGGVILLVIFLRRRAKGGSNDAAMLKRKPSPPEFLPIAFGKSMTESKLPRKDRDTYVPGLQKLKEVSIAALFRSDSNSILFLVDHRKGLAHLDGHY